MRVNWHLAAACAIEIDLRDYSDILSYQREAPLHDNTFRIDLLIIRKNSDVPITKLLAKDFRKLNLFEIKGIGSSVTVRSYYKLLAYAGIYIHDHWKEEKLTAEHITLSLLGRHRPRRLFSTLKHLGKPVEKLAPGIYNVGNESFLTRIIVTSELSPDHYAYLRCLTNDPDIGLLRQIDKDCKEHYQEINYTDYVDQLFRANNNNEKGGLSMSKYPEALFEYYGTSSDQIKEEQCQKDLAEIEEANSRAAIAYSQAEEANSRAEYFLNLLLQHGINPEKLNAQ